MNLLLPQDAIEHRDTQNTGASESCLEARGNRVRVRITLSAASDRDRLLSFPVSVEDDRRDVQALISKDLPKFR